MKTGVILSDFAQHLGRKNADVPDIYYNLLDAAAITPTLVLNQNAKTKKRGSWVLFRLQTSEAAIIVHPSWCCFGSMRNLVKTSNLSVPKVRQFLLPKPRYFKFTLDTYKFKSVKVFARFKNLFWCLGLAYVDKLAKDYNGVKYQLVHQDVFVRTVDAKGMKTKDSKETFHAFLTMIIRKNRLKKVWVDKGTESAGEFKKLCKVGLQI